MASKTLVNDPQNLSYEAGANWVGGVAPTNGDTVTIQTLYQGGPAPVTATGVAFVDQQITLTQDGSISGGLEVAGGSSFDAQTTVTGTVDGNVLDLNGIFNTAGTITDVDINIVSGAGQNIDTNTGTIDYNRAPISDPAFGIDTGDTGASFINDGVINVTNQPGGQLTGGTAFPTDVTIATPFSGTGVVNITGDQPNATAAAPYVGSQAQVTISTDSPVSGTNTFNLNDGELIVSSTTTGTLNLLDSSGLLNFTGAPVINTGLDIVGFRAGDIIGLGSAEVKPGTLSYNASTDILSFTDVNSGSVLSLHITPTGTQSYTTASFQEETGIGDFTSSESIVTTEAAPCYCPGTLIRTDQGEVAVEALRIGDHVITLDDRSKPIKWIGRRAYAGCFIEGRRDVLPVCMQAGSLGEGLPLRDLVVSPLHAMFLDGVLVPAGLLVNGVSITQAQSVEIVEYIHIELDEHAVIWAEGAASESFVDDNSRGMFQNVHEFNKLYAAQVRLPAVYCAPRVEHGERLVAIKDVIDSRAGLAAPRPCEPLRGVIDGSNGVSLWGWAQNPDKPEVPVCLEVLVGGVVIQRTLANTFRPDLRAAGIGSGRHSFKVALPGNADGRSIEVRRVADGAIVGHLKGRPGSLQRKRRAAA